MSEIVMSHEEPELGKWMETHIEYTEGLGVARKSLDIVAYLTFDEMVALVCKLIGGAE